MIHKIIEEIQEINSRYGYDLILEPYLIPLNTIQTVDKLSECIILLNERIEKLENKK